MTRPKSDPAIMYPRARGPRPAFVHRRVTSRLDRHRRPAQYSEGLADVSAILVGSGDRRRRSRRATMSPTELNERTAPSRADPIGVPSPDDSSAFDAPEFLDRLRSADRAISGPAFEALVREAMPRMLAVARKFLPEENDACDAVQDAFLSAYKALASFAGDSRLTTWLHRITVNACLMKLRTRKRRPEVKIDDLMPRFDPTGHHEKLPAFWNEPPSAGIEHGEMMKSVRSCIQRLPDDFREVVIMRDIEGIDTATTASLLAISESAVKTRLHRARLALRTMMDEHTSKSGALMTDDRIGGDRRGRGASSSPPRGASPEVMDSPLAAPGESPRTPRTGVRFPEGRTNQ
jgi:RNA polymerase sigma-70 factor, ECF subfamily